MTSRAERLAERFAPPAPPTPKPTGRAATPPPDRVEARWEELNQRFTVWLPRVLVAEARAAAAKRGESIATLVTRALRKELGHGKGGGAT
jgi:hypothetical protein